MTAPSQQDQLAWLRDAIAEPEGRDAAGAALLEWLETKNEMAAAVAEMKASIRRMEEAF